MKFSVLFAVVFFAAIVPASAQSPAATDWRNVDSERDRDFIENWEGYFDDAYRASERARSDAFHGINRQQFGALKQTSQLDSIPVVKRREVGCQTIETVWFSTSRGDLLPCTLEPTTNGWRLRKLVGGMRYDLMLNRSDSFGIFAIGEWWAEAEAGRKNRGRTDRRTAGIVRQASQHKLHIFLPGELGYLNIIVVDLAYRWPRPHLEPDR